MTAGDAGELAALLGLRAAHSQGVSVAASRDHRREYVERAAYGRASTRGSIYWD